MTAKYTTALRQSTNEQLCMDSHNDQDGLLIMGLKYETASDVSIDDSEQDSACLS